MVALSRFAVLFVVLSGCRFAKPLRLSELAGQVGRFEPSEFVSAEVSERGGESVSVRFDGVPLGRAFATLSDLTGRPIVWAESLDSRDAVGYFDNQPLGLVLDALGRRVGAEVNDLGGVLYVGEVGPDDLASAVVPLPPGDSEGMAESFRELLTSRGRMAIVNGSLFVRDSADAVAKLIREMESHRLASVRRYVAEVYLMRVRKRDLLSLSARLQVRGVDLLQQNNLQDLFEIVGEAEGGIEGAEVWRRPVLHLSEGQTGQLFVGRTVSVPERATNESGVIETTGFQQFEDGLRVEMSCRRVSVGLLSCDVLLRFAEFQQSDRDVPDQDKEEVTTNVIVGDGEVVLVGALGRDSKTNVWRLFGSRLERSADTMLVWMRVRELSPVALVRSVACDDQGFFDAFEEVEIQTQLGEATADVSDPGASTAAEPMSDSLELAPYPSLMEDF